MNPQDRRARLEARNAAMRQQVDSLLSGLTRQTTALQQAQAQAAEVTGRATSDDGLVTVTVNAAGVVTDVGFAPTAFTRGTPDTLARVVVAVIQQATAEAARQVDALLAPARGDVPDLPDVVAGAPSLRDLLPPPATPPSPATRQPPRTRDEDEDFSTGSVLWGNR